MNTLSTPIVNFYHWTDKKLIKMEQIASLKDGLIQQVKSLYDGEMHIADTIPKMREKVTSTDVREFLDRQEDEKSRQFGRLAEVLKHLNIDPEGETNEGIRAITKHKKLVLDRCQSKKIYDTMLVIYNRSFTMLQVNAYQTAINLSNEIEDREISRLLRRCLREEKGLEKHLGLLEEELIEDMADIPVPA